MMRLHYRYHGKLCIFRTRKRLHLWPISVEYLDGIGLPRLMTEYDFEEWWP